MKKYKARPHSLSKSFKKDWMNHHGSPPWEQGFEHFSRHFPHQRKKMLRRFWGGVLFLGIPTLVVGIALGLVIGGNQELLGSRELRRLTFCAIPFLIPIIGMLVGTLGVRRWVNPLADVMSAAESLAEGDFTVRVKEEGDQEFVKLARSFNHMAEELDHARQQRQNLTADVAHELRTPLHILQGNLEGALDGVYQATPEYFKSMLEETSLLQRLVEDLQTLSRAESGTLDFHFQTLNVSDLINDVQASFQAKADEIGVVLKTEIPGEMEDLTIEGDWHRLDQVLGNLVSNALRFTKKSGTITFGVMRVDSVVKIIISDTGEGIHPDDLPYIFDRFWKGDKPRSRTGGGSGLGLAIAKQLVTAHGGKLQVTSQIGKGSTFTIEIPYLKD